MHGSFPLLVNLVFLSAAAPGGDGGLEIDRSAGVVRVPALVAKQGAYEVLQGAIEYVLVSAGGKDYESLFVTELKPEEIHAALIQIGLEPGRPAGRDSPPAGSEARIAVEYEHDGKRVRRAVDELVVHAKTGKPLDPAAWAFTGSVKAFDPEAKKDVLQYALTKSIVGLHYTDPSPLFQNPRPEAATENIYKARLEELPEAGTRVQVVFEMARRSVPKGTRRARAVMSGRVDGVGFEVFAERRAKVLGLTGYVKCAEKGRLESLIEGPAENVARFLEQLRAGPRAARIEKIETKDEPTRGDLKDFQIKR